MTKPPTISGVDLPVIRLRFGEGRRNGPFWASAASWLARRFSRRRSSMAAEARHNVTGTDCSTWQADDGTTAVLTPVNHWLSGTAGGIGLPILGCTFALRDLSCATRPPPFQIPQTCRRKYLSTLSPCAPRSTRKHCTIPLPLSTSFCVACWLGLLGL